MHVGVVNTVNSWGTAVTYTINPPDVTMENLPQQIKQFNYLKDDLPPPSPHPAENGLTDLFLPYDNKNSGVKQGGNGQTASQGCSCKAEAGRAWLSGFRLKLLAVINSTGRNLLLKGSCPVRGPGTGATRQRFLA